MNPIVTLAASALPGEKKYILFAGAGISKDAGIPTSWELMIKTASLLYASETDKIDSKIDLEKWFIDSKYSKMSYSKIMELIYPKTVDQQSFLRQFLGKYQVGKSHKGIAELVRRGIIRAIITTNFDNYIEKALEEIGIETQVISTIEDLRNSEPLIHCKVIRIYKPHGTLDRGLLKNTPNDLEKLDPVMEDELIRVISEHGVIFLGYSGRDPCILEIIKKQECRHFPSFWVNLKIPDGDYKEILDRKGYIFITCSGAGQFINDFISLQDKIKSLGPEIGKGPTITELEKLLSEKSELVLLTYKEFLKNIYNELVSTKPDLSKFSNIDEAIIEQIRNGKSITYSFVESVLLASKYNNLEAIESIYDYFGSALKLYNIPDGFSGQYNVLEFDGYKFLIYEMFVDFIASLIKFDRWEKIGGLLSRDIFIEKRKSKFVSISYISQYIKSIDEIRDKRLKLNRVSVTADMINNRYTQENLSELISHKEFLEADYFLFMRTLTHSKDPSSFRDIWCPRSCIYLDYPPSYLVKSESKGFASKMVNATGYASYGHFFKELESQHNLFKEYFKRKYPFIDSPLNGFDFTKIATRN